MSGDRCEYLFSHLNALTAALARLGSDGSSLGSEGVIPSKIIVLTLDYNFNGTTSNNGNFGMVWFVGLLLIGAVLLHLWGNSITPTNTKPSAGSAGRNNHDFHRDRNDPVN